MLIIASVCLGSVIFGLGMYFGRTMSFKENDEYVKSRDKIYMELIKDKNDLIKEIHEEFIELKKQSEA